MAKLTIQKIFDELMESRRNLLYTGMIESDRSTSAQIIGCVALELLEQYAGKQLEDKKCCCRHCPHEDY